MTNTSDSNPGGCRRCHHIRTEGPSRASVRVHEAIDHVGPTGSRRRPQRAAEALRARAVVLYGAIAVSPLSNASWEAANTHS